MCQTIINLIKLQIRPMFTTVAMLAAVFLICHPVYALDNSRLAIAVAQEETALHARIGVAIIDTESGAEWQHRGNERFPLNSTYKVFACAAVLARAESHQLNLDARIPIDANALVTYSPVTGKLPPDDTMSLRELCRAAVSMSDNTAANLALDAIGGAPALMRFMRSIGDDKTRLDRREPELNQATPGDLRDTTTPLAAARSLRALLLGDVLYAPARSELTQWMIEDQVAGALLRRGLPKNWSIADKSGAGGHGSRSIIAVVWPPKRSAIVIAIYITQTAAPMSESDQAISRIGSALAKALK